MFGTETPMGRTPLQGVSLDVASPRAEALGYSVRPLRGHWKMSNLLWEAQAPPPPGVWKSEKIELVLEPAERHRNIGEIEIE